MEVTIKCVLDAKKENRIIIVPATITDAQLSQKLSQTFGCPVRISKYEDPKDHMLITIDSVSNLQHAFKVYAQMLAKDPLLALLLFLELDSTGPLSSRPIGVASSSSSPMVASGQLSSADPLSTVADSALKRLTESRKGSAPNVLRSTGDSFRTPPKTRPDLARSSEEGLNQGPSPSGGSSLMSLTAGVSGLVIPAGSSVTDAPAGLASPQGHRRDHRRVSGLATKAAAEALSAPATLTHNMNITTITAAAAGSAIASGNILIPISASASNIPTASGDRGSSGSRGSLSRPRPFSGTVPKVSFVNNDGAPTSPVYEFTPPPSPRESSSSTSDQTTINQSTTAVATPSTTTESTSQTQNPYPSSSSSSSVAVAITTSSSIADRKEFSRTPPPVSSPDRSNRESINLNTISSSTSTTLSTPLSNPPPPLDKADASNSLLGRSQPQTQIGAQQQPQTTSSSNSNTLTVMSGGPSSSPSASSSRLSGGVSGGVMKGPAGSRSETHIKFTLPDPKILLGWGAFGAVYLGMRDNGAFVAVKQLQLAENPSVEQLNLLDSFEKEIHIMKRLQHPNIVAYLGTQRTQSSLNIILEYVPGGSIASLLKRFGPFPEPVIRSYTRQTLLGLRYLHEHQPNPVVHRDIKGGNILVDQSGVVKLADFGCSKIVVNATVPAGGKSGVTGTPNWMAPEAINPQKAGASSTAAAVAAGPLPLDSAGSAAVQGAPADIWSLGCTVIEMGTAKVPWAEQSMREITALMFMIFTSTALPEFPPNLSELGRNFLHSCLKRDPSQRLSAAALLQHPFLETASDSLSASPSHSGNPNVVDDTDPAAAGSRVSPSIADRNPTTTNAAPPASANDASPPSVANANFTPSPSPNANVLRTVLKNSDSHSNSHNSSSAFNELRNSDVREIQTAVHEHQSLLHSMAMKAMLSVPGHILRLTPQLLVRVLLHCGNSAEELLKLSLVCKEWYQCMSDDVGFWKRLYEHKYRGLEPKQDITQSKGRRSANLSWRQKYSMQRQLEHSWRDLKNWQSTLLKVSSSFRSGKVNVSCLRAKESLWAVSCGADDKKIRLWDLVKRKSGKSLKGHTAGVTCLSLDGNWSRLYSGSADRTVRLWDVANRKLLRTFSAHSDELCAVVHFEPARLAAASRDRVIRIWDTLHGNCVATWQAHSVSGGGGSAPSTLKGSSSGVTSATMLLSGPVDNFLLSACDADNIWKIWDLRMYNTNNPVVISNSVPTALIEWRLSSSVITSALFASSTTVYIGDREGCIREWDLRRSPAELVRVIRAHSDAVKELALSEDGHCLMSASRDHSIKLWNRFSASDKPMHSLQTGDQVQALVSLSERGKLISATVGEKGIRLWQSQSAGLPKSTSGQSMLLATSSASSSSSALSSVIGGSATSVGSV